MPLNKVQIIGFLGADPETFETTRGSVTRLSVATTEKWTDNDGTEKERTEWHRVSVFNGQGKTCQKYLKKGSQVYVEGSLRTSKYEKDGETKYSTEIVANPHFGVQFLDRKPATSDDN
jgi:single-strand DNA-binding protein